MQRKQHWAHTNSRAPGIRHNERLIDTSPPKDGGVAAVWLRLRVSRRYFTHTRRECEQPGLASASTARHGAPGGWRIALRTGQRVRDEPAEDLPFR